MSRLRITLASLIACLFVAGAAVIAPLFAQGPSHRATRPPSGRSCGSTSRRATPRTRRPSSRCSRPTPTSSSRMGRGGRGATSWSGACSSRRSGPAAGGASPSNRSGCSRPDVALADGRYTQTGVAGGGNRAMWTTIVLKRGPDGWRIAAIRNMLPATPAPSQELI